MKKCWFFWLVMFIDFRAIADCEIQTKNYDCFTVFTKSVVFSAFPV